MAQDIKKGELEAASKNEERILSGNVSIRVPILSEAGR